MKNPRIKLPKGVIKIKAGYNPNSSSIGTVLYSLPHAFAAVTAVLAILAVLLPKKDDRGKERQ
jgi:hypothetical protein